MNAPTLSPWPPASAALMILLDAAVKSTLVLAVAGLAIRGMRRSSAAARHFVWFVAVASLLVLPLLSWTLPGWQILPRWMSLRPETRIAQNPSLALHPVSRPSIEPLSIEPVNQVDSEPAGQPAAARESTTSVRQPEPRAAAPALPRAPFNWWRLALVIWFAGTTLALVPTFLGRLSLWRLERGSRRETAASWLELLRNLLAGLNLTRAVHLLKTDRRRMPMTWGVFRPRLLLPEQSQEWPEDRRRVVMLHELAHAKRWDYLTNLITQLACALYWFNPLVWLAARQMIAEREQACDDVVLRHGAKPSDYAEQILHIAAGLPAERFAVYAGIAMARPSKLEGRLRAILDDRCNRTTLTRLVAIAALALLTLVVVPVAMMRAASGNNAASQNAGLAAAGWGEETNGFRTRVAADSRTFRAGQPIFLKLEVTNVSDRTKSFQTPAAPWHNDLIVVDAKGKPVPFIAGSAQVAVTRSNVNAGRAVEAKAFDLTDYYYVRSPGRYTVTWPGERVMHIARDEVQSLPTSGVFSFEVVADARANDDGDPVGKLLPLIKDEWSIGNGGAKLGKVRPGSNREEVSGRFLSLQYHPTGYKVDSGLVWLWLTDEAAGPAEPTGDWPPPSDYLGKSSRWHVYLNISSNALKAWPTVRNDLIQALRIEPSRDAEARLASVPPVVRAQPAIQSSGETNFTMSGTVSDADTHQPIETFTVTPGPFVVTGRVTDEQGNGLEGVTITANCGNGTLRKTGETTTDSIGRYTLRFREGMSVWREGNWGVGVQAATISPRKAGYFETNLGRGGDLLMADTTPVPGVNIHTNVDLAKVVLTNQPHELNFVMKPAANVRGILMGPATAPMIFTTIWLEGDQLPPSSSVLGETVTDKDGRFHFEDVPTGYTWRFKLENKLTREVKFREPGDSVVQLFVQFVRDNASVQTLESAGEPQKPATLIVRYDVPGDLPVSGLSLKRIDTNSLMPAWFPQTTALNQENLVSSNAPGWLPQITVANKTEIVLPDLLPGSYVLSRRKIAELPGLGTNQVSLPATFDSRPVVLESGRTQRVDFVRAGGQAIRGTVAGLKESGAAGAYILVRSADASTNIANELRLPVYEATACGPDGQFEIPMMGPGTYTIVAAAYKKLLPYFWVFFHNQSFGLGGVGGEEGNNEVFLEPGHPPDFIGATKVTIRSNPSPAQARIEVHPWRFSSRVSIGAVSQPGAASQPAPAGPARAEESAELGAAGSSSTGDIRGVLVDDTTGKAITNFWLQTGESRSDNSNEIVWSKSLQGPVVTDSQGRFGLHVENARQAWRILVDGYPPLIIRATTHADGLVVRMRRSGELRGIVLDYSGRPVAGARVTITNVDAQFPADSTRPTFESNSRTTDREGRFAIPQPVIGGSKALVVTPDGQMMLPVPITDLGEDLKISLPRPATLIVRYDIPGDVPEAFIGMKLRTFAMETPLWQGVDFEITSKVANRGQVVLTNLMPGPYVFIRQKPMPAGRRGPSLDHRQFDLEAGQTKQIDLVRSTGRQVHGIVTGLEQAGISGGVISVRSGEFNRNSIDAPTFGKDGRFQTALLEPDTYYFSVAGSPDARRGATSSSTGRPLRPEYFASTNLTVDAYADPPSIVLELAPFNLSNRIAQLNAMTNRPAPSSVGIPASVQRQIDAQLPKLPPGLNLRGRVLDDVTGQPIVDFVVQRGMTNFTNPGEISWQHHMMGGPQNPGAWSGRLDDSDRAVRILAPGYVPEILTKESIAGKNTSDLEVRLKRGDTVQGIVVDADGRPVSKARVYLTTTRPVFLKDDGFQLYNPFKGASTTTDNAGRFVLRGEGGTSQKVVIASSDSHLVWPVVQTNPRQDMRITLPRTGTLIVRYDIPGDVPEATPDMYLITTNKDRPLWKDLSVDLSFTVTNRGETILTNLTPGTYSVRRWKSADREHGAETERQIVLVEGGKTQYLDLVRTNGQRIRGRVVGLEQSPATGGYIYVRSPQATGQQWARQSRNEENEMLFPSFDVLKFGADGTFETAMLKPGTYSVIAHLYPPGAPAGGFPYHPDFVGLAKVTVTGEPAPPVTIQLGQARSVEISGTVVDDETSAVISRYAIQRGKISPETPGEVTWSPGYSGPGSDGKFLAWDQKEGDLIRFLANGYLPKAFTRSEVMASGKTANLSVRLQRGGELRGVVLDHAAWPAANAKVILAPLERVDIPPVSWGGRPGEGYTFGVTDAAGRFSMRGVGDGSARVIVVSDDGRMVHPMQPAAGVKELNVTLPAPASLVVHYDIPGDVPELNFNLQLQTNQLETLLWKGVRLNSWEKVPNGRQIVVNNLTPGTYDFSRLRMGGTSNSAFSAYYGSSSSPVKSDNQTLLLESGRTQRVDLVRTAGQRVQGRVTGLAPITNLMNSFLYVGSATAISDPRDFGTTLTPCFDAIKLDKDGNFQTALLEPGTYTVIVEAFVPGKPPERKPSDSEPRWGGGSFIMVPPQLAYVGSAKVTVTAESAPTPVRIELRPWENPTNAPAASPGGNQAAALQKPEPRIADANWGSSVNGISVLLELDHDNPFQNFPGLHSESSNASPYFSFKVHVRNASSNHVDVSVYHTGMSSDSNPVSFEQGGNHIQVDGKWYRWTFPRRSHWTQWAGGTGFTTVGRGVENEHLAQLISSPGKHTLRIGVSAQPINTDGSRGREFYAVSNPIEIEGRLLPPIQWQAAGSTNNTRTSAGSISGNVTDFDTGKPVERFTVTPGNPSGQDLMAWDSAGATEATNGVYRLNAQPAMILVEAAGYAPEMSGGASAVLDFKLRKSNGVEGTVLDPEGRPVAHAQVAFRLEYATLHLGPARFRWFGFNPNSHLQVSPHSSTDGAGRFSLPPAAGALAFVAIDDRGFAEQSFSQLPMGVNTSIRLQPWARIEGTLRAGGQPLTNEVIGLVVKDPLARGLTLVELMYQTNTDSAGRFVFTQVPPGEFSLYHQLGGRYRTAGFRESAPMFWEFVETGGRIERRYFPDVVETDAGQTTAVELEASTAAVRPDEPGRDPTPKPQTQTQTPEVQLPSGTLSESEVRLVAIGRTNRWWNADGKEVAMPAADPRSMPLCVVLDRTRLQGELQCEFRSPDNPALQRSGWGISSGGGSKGEVTSYLVRDSAGELDAFLDSGGPVDFVFRHGVEPWQEIGTIQEGETVEADGGRFTLKHVERARRLVVNATFDFDPAYEITFVAVGATRSPIAAGNRAGPVHGREDRQFSNSLEMNGSLDHFAILKRPLKEFVVRVFPQPANERADAGASPRRPILLASTSPDTVSLPTTPTRPAFQGDDEFLLGQSSLVVAGQIESPAREQRNSTNWWVYHYSFKVTDVIKGTAPGDVIQVASPWSTAKGDPPHFEPGEKLVLFLAKSGFGEKPVWMTLGPASSIQPASPQLIGFLKRRLDGGPAEPFTHKYDLPAEERTALDVRILPVANVITPAPITNEYGVIMWVMGLPVRVENHSSQTLTANLPEARLGPFSPTDFGAAVRSLDDSSEWWRRKDVRRVRSNQAPAERIAWRPGQSHEFNLHLSWQGTNDPWFGPLIRSDRPGRYSVLVSLAFKTGERSEYAVSAPMEIQTLPEPPIAEGPVDPAAFSERKAEPGWGEPVEGVSVRLQADKAVWTSGETPSFKVSVRNLGVKRPGIGVAQKDLGEFEVDGVAYFWDGDGRQGQALLPGEQRDDIAVGFPTNWTTRLRRPLLLSPGKHTVRFAAIPILWSRPVGGMDTNMPQNLHIFSNPVEIECRTSEAEYTAAVRAAAGGPDKTGIRTDAPLADYAGHVVDDMTGESITNVDIVLQSGTADPEKPERITWDQSFRGPVLGKPGYFTAQTWKRWETWRILADGYLPELLVAPPNFPGSVQDLIVRLKRGGELRGVVLDHSGKPVSDAKVVLNRYTTTRIVESRPQLVFGGSTATTDLSGRFRLQGADGTESGVVVMSRGLQLWAVSNAVPGQDLRITLPKPAALTVHYAISGDSADAELGLQLSEVRVRGSQWDALESEPRHSVRNGGSLTVTNLAPGSYLLYRMKWLKVGDSARGVPCDRTSFTLESGEHKLVEMVRSTGYPVRGEVVGLAGTEAAGALIYVRSAEATGDPHKPQERGLPLFDALTCGKDGQFQTARLEPGTYTITVDVYLPEVPDIRNVNGKEVRVWSTGERLPNYVGTAKVTVTDAAAPEPVRIQIARR